MMTPLAFILYVIGELVDDWHIWRPFNAIINHFTYEDPREKG